MKIDRSKTAALLLVLILPLGLLGQTHHEQKSEGKNSFFSAGLGAVYGSAHGNWGLNLRSYYNIGEQKLCFGPELAVYQKARAHGHPFRTIELGMIGHYIFHLSPHSGIYPLTGPNMTLERIQKGDLGTEMEKFWGWSAGAGIHLAFGHWAPYVEWKYLFGKASQQVISAGLICNFR